MPKQISMARIAEICASHATQEEVWRAHYRGEHAGIIQVVADPDKIPTDDGRPLVFAKCPPCGHTASGATEDEAVANLNLMLSPEQILHPLLPKTKTPSEMADWFRSKECEVTS